MIRRFFYRLFGKKQQAVHRNYVFGNAELLKVSVGTFDQGDRARVVCDLKIAGTDSVIRDVIWLVPVVRISDMRSGHFVSVRYAPGSHFVELVGT